MPVEPLIIEALLTHGLVSYKGAFNLDAILMHKVGRGVEETADGDVIRPRLPLAAITCAGAEIYASSDAIVNDGSSARGYTVRRRDSTDIEMIGQKHSVKSGPKRNHLKPMPLTVTAKLRWYAVGDRMQIKTLLGAVRHLGGMRKHGYGRVRSWSVEPCNINPYLHSGLTLRSIPAAWCAGEIVAAPLPVRPPYWHRSSLADAVPAGSAVRLTAEAKRAVDRIAET